MSIVNEAKAEIKAQKKANKVVKSYTKLQIIKAVVAIVVLLSLGAFAGITIDRAIKSTIDNEVQAQVQSLTKE